MTWLTPSLAESPADLDLLQSGHRIRNGEMTSVDLVKAQLQRIADRDLDIGALVHVAGDEALAAAARADAELARELDRGPLHGLPFAVKDLIDVANWPVRSGSASRAGRMAEGTAPVVARLQEAGAIPLGLAATYELATVGPDCQSLYPQPRNPWNRAHVTGGSSSGSAAAIAAGLVRFALGTDTGGSIRSPSAFCGICGFKPEKDSLPMDGVQPLAPTLDVVGPMARTMGDLALVYSVLGGADIPLTGVASGLRLGYARGWGVSAEAHPALLPLMDDAAAALSLAGASITLIDLPDYVEFENTAARILQAEQSVIHADLIADATSRIGPMARKSLLWGHPLPPEAEAMARSDRLRQADILDAALAPFDAVILPVTLGPAPRFSDFAEGTAVWTPMRTLPFNMTGHAALSLPMGQVDGLPMGLQITAARGRSAEIFRTGLAFESMTDHQSFGPYSVSGNI